MIYNIDEFERVIDIRGLKRIFSENNIGEDNFYKLLNIILNVSKKSKYEAVKGLFEKIKCRQCSGYGIVLRNREFDECNECNGFGIIMNTAGEFQNLLKILK